jgi:hypothetical protein
VNWLPIIAICAAVASAYFFGVWVGTRVTLRAIEADEIRAATPSALHESTIERLRREDRA